ncbi:hypothetical protein [Campylobacter mucosalis]|uniref:Uncharacterized protein n=1 Tax=Campylobacter mucosalis CCUG 21559 TaxID=1032067 RepID=A0A6G5QGD1_9BACT|nr:hypothetical protein [Campylobacter mucosalis]QCD44103.1 hypothetical protein CMUC_0289 [Campylobacter mucosalis CCUG 21559]QCD44692.1 hypothetical protein CMUC_0903 [Campylobacter mucosalis CCUG 21559]
MVTQTSREAYKEIKPFLTGKRKAIYELFLQHKDGATRQEIARWYHQGINIVCGRANELMSQGYLVICGYKKDSVSGKQNEILKAVKRV